MTSTTPPAVPSKPSERRRVPRFKTDQLKGTLPFDHEIAVLDVSLDGLAIESRQRLVPGRGYSVHLPVNEEDSVRTTGTVIWCRLLGTQRVQDDVVPIFRAGLRLDAPLEPAVLELVDAGAARRSGNGTRVQARFKTSALASATLGGDAPFEVESISRFGMAAVMDFCPSVRSMVDFVLSLGDADLEIRGRVADVVERGDRPGKPTDGTHYLVGIEFSDLSPSARKALAAYLTEGWGEASKAS